MVGSWEGNTEGGVGRAGVEEWGGGVSWMLIHQNYVFIIYIRKSVTFYIT